MVLFDINFALHCSRSNISSERENKYLVFLFGSVAHRADLSTHVQIYPHMCRFLKMFGFLRFFSTFVYEKTETKWEYVLYEWVWEIFLEISLIFLQKLPSAYIFINCTNLWKFVIIVFNTYLNFIKLSNTSTIFWKASIKFE